MRWWPVTFLPCLGQIYKMYNIIKTSAFAYCSSLLFHSISKAPPQSPMFLILVFPLASCPWLEPFHDLSWSVLQVRYVTDGCGVSGLTPDLEKQMSPPLHPQGDLMVTIQPEFRPPALNPKIKA